MSSITASSQITKSSNYNNNSLDQYERLLKENQENKKKILNLNEKINELTLINQNQKINFDKINNNLTQKYSKELKELKFKVESNDIEKFKIESNYKIKFNEIEKQKKMLELKNKNLTNKINEITLNEKNLENEIKLTFDERAKNQKKIIDDYILQNKNLNNKIEELNNKIIDLESKINEKETLLNFNKTTEIEIKKKIQK